MECNRAELQSRRRRKGESVQDVYQDIRRLKALRFPGESGDFLEIIGRDAFLSALADPALCIRVLDQQSHTLDNALSCVVRMEAYGPLLWLTMMLSNVNTFASYYRRLKLMQAGVFVN